MVVAGAPVNLCRGIFLCPVCCCRQFDQSAGLGQIGGIAAMHCWTAYLCSGHDHCRMVSGPLRAALWLDGLGPVLSAFLAQLTGSLGLGSNSTFMVL